MSSGADIISFAAHAREALAAGRAAGEDETRLAHLASIADHGDPTPPAVDADPAKPADIQFPLRSIPKWVPTGE